MPLDRVTGRAPRSRKPVQRKPNPQAAPTRTRTNDLTTATEAIQRAALDPTSLSAADMIALQHTVGNRAVEHLVGGTAQRAADPGQLGGGPAQPDVEQSIQQAQGGGSPLPNAARADLEPKFGADFGSVRVHTGPQADQLNRSLSAKAFTTGSDIFFRQGTYSPGTSTGKHLLAHELTHVVQQGGSRPTAQRKLTVGPANDQYEQEADRVASDVLRMPDPTAPAVAPGEAGIQRKFPGQRAGATDRIAPQVGRTKLSGVKRASRSIQRFAFSDAPSTWGDVDEVKRSGEGVKGVYFVTKGQAKVVVKPEENPGSIDFANKFAQHVDLEAPQMATYPKTSSEGQALAHLLTTKTIGARSEDEVATQLAGANFFLVMSLVSGASIQRLDDEKALAFVTSEKAMNQVGRLYVMDAFLGNSDRLLGNVNLGNFFFDVVGGNVITIDNESVFGEWRGSRQSSYGDQGLRIDGPLGSSMSNLNLLMDATGRMGVISSFITKITATFARHPQASAAINKRFIVEKISAGIVAGLRELSRLLAAHSNIVRGIQTQNQQFGEARKDGFSQQSKSAAKALSLYLQARMSGQNEEGAKQAVKAYAEYRIARGRKWKGFKWTSKAYHKMTKPTGILTNWKSNSSIGLFKKRSPALKAIDTFVTEFNQLESPDEVPEKAREFGSLTDDTKEGLFGEWKKSKGNGTEYKEAARYPYLRSLQAAIYNHVQKATENQRYAESSQGYFA
jgi:hypothetical protein